MAVSGLVPFLLFMVVMMVVVFIILYRLESSEHERLKGKFVSSKKKRMMVLLENYERADSTDVDSKHFQLEGDSYWEEAKHADTYLAVFMDEHAVEQKKYLKCRIYIDKGVEVPHLSYYLMDRLYINPVIHYPKSKHVLKEL
jgi:hypothetical protein